MPTQFGVGYACAQMIAKLSFARTKTNNKKQNAKSMNYQAKHQNSKYFLVADVKDGKKKSPGRYSKGTPWMCLANGRYPIVMRTRIT